MVEREWREASDMRPSVFILAIIITVAALLRFVAIGSGIPFNLGVDEPEIMGRVVHMMRTGDFNPHFFDYPGLYLYLQLGVAVVRFLIGATFGHWTSLDHVGCVFGNLISAWIFARAARRGYVDERLCRATRC